MADRRGTDQAGGGGAGVALGLGLGLLGLGLVGGAVVLTRRQTPPAAPPPVPLPVGAPPDPPPAPPPADPPRARDPGPGFIVRPVGPLGPASLAVLADHRAALAVVPVAQAQIPPSSIWREGAPDEARLIQLADTYAAAVKRWKAWLEDQARGLGIAVKEYEQAQADMKTAGVVIGTISATVSTVAAQVAAGTAAIPVVGQVIAAVGALVSLVAGIVRFFTSPDFRSASERAAGVTIYGGADNSWNGGVIFTGWVNDLNTPGGCYFFYDVPVIGPEVDQFYEGLGPGLKQEWAAKGWEAFYKLCKRYPWGPPVPFVKVGWDGAYDFKFIVGAPAGAPLTEPEVAAGNVRNLIVYDVEEVKPVLPPRLVAQGQKRNPVPEDPYAPWRGTPLEPYIPKQYGGEGKVLPSYWSGTDLENINLLLSPEARALIPAGTVTGRQGVAPKDWRR